MYGRWYARETSGGDDTLNIYLSATATELWMMFGASLALYGIGLAMRSGWPLLASSILGFVFAWYGALSIGLFISIIPVSALTLAVTRLAGARRKTRRIVVAIVIVAWALSVAAILRSVTS